MAGEKAAENRYCRKCLLSEYDAQAYRETIVAFIDRLREEDRADEQVYEQRLSVCKECDKLEQGTCLSCGCYVELRAAAVKAHCPKKKW